MNYWLTTDWHLGHENIKEYENRPDNFEELILKHHKEVIGKDDILINLGDTIFSNKINLKDYMSQIDCRKKILVRGNHDKCHTDSWFINNGFDSVCDIMAIKKVFLSHKPIELPPFSINIHGHMHSGNMMDTSYYSYYSSHHFLLGLENTNYYPVKISDIINGKYIKGNKIIR